MALATMTPVGAADLICTSVSASAAIPGASPTTIIFTNLGQVPIFVALGIGSATATVNNLCVLPMSQSVPIGVGTNTFFAGITAAGSLGNAALHVDTGT